LWVVCVVR